MLRITKDTKYYGIDNIEKIITEMKSPIGFTVNIEGTWGFYTKNPDEKNLSIQQGISKKSHLHTFFYTLHHLDFHAGSII